MTARSLAWEAGKGRWKIVMEQMAWHRQLRHPQWHQEAGFPRLQQPQSGPKQKVSDVACLLSFQEGGRL